MPWILKTAGCITRTTQAYGGCGWTERVTPQKSYHIACFGGILYFADEDLTKLYRKPPGKAPELLDESTPICRLSVSDGVLRYGDGVSVEKAIDLNPFQPGNIPDTDMRGGPPAAVAASHTYAIEVAFSKPMDTSLLPGDKIGLMTDAGQSLPLHLFWSGGGKTLTIRSASELVLGSDVTLYLAPGLRSGDAQYTRYGAAKRIAIKSAAPQ